MALRFIGATFVIIACAAIGFKQATDLRREIKTLADMVDVLNFMERELSYRLTPLPKLCRLSSEQGKSFKTLLICLAEELESQISTDVASCMNAAICRNTGFADSIVTCLQELGSSFGKFDLEGQLNGIDSVRQKCINRLDELEKDKDIRIRNYQTLGLCAGAALAIVLF